MDETEIVEALASLEEKSLGRIGDTETKLKAIETSLADLQKSIVLGGGSGRGGDPSTSSPEERKCIESGIRELLRGNNEKATELFAQAQRKSNIAGSGPDGGYIVAGTLGDLQRIPITISPMSALSREIVLTEGTVYSEPTDRELLAAAWVGEVDARPDTATPKLIDFRVEANELYCMPKASQKLIDSARIDVLGWLTSKVQEGFGYAEDVAFFTGDGVARPRGLLTFPTTSQDDSVRPWGTIQYVPTGASGAFPTPTTSVGAADPLFDCVASLRPTYRTNATWLMSRQTAAAIRKLKNAVGDNIWQDSIAAGTPDRLCGYPISYSESMPSIGPNSLSVAFGDIERTYCIVRRAGVKMLTDPYTDKPNVRLYAYQRVGGSVSNFESVKFVKFSNS